MKVAIVGFGMEGQSAFDYFSKSNYDITIFDENPQVVVPDGAKSVLGENAFVGLSDFDLIFRTAGLRPEKILGPNPGIEDKITTQLNEFLKNSQSSNIIGVTGTKGKGTTTTLIAKMLEAAGKSVIIGGNIGIPMIDLLDKVNHETYAVLELSSFQLCDLKTKSPHIAVCVMIAPEHLNWHKDLEDYLNAKAQLFKHQDENDIAIYFVENEYSTKIASSSPGSKIPYFTPPGAYIENDAVVIDGQVIIQTKDIKLLGKHNWQNICAAVTAVWQVTKNVEAIHSVLTSFTGLQHRLELVRELDGIKYYDDSFGTTPETAIVAVEAFNQPKVLILGGSVKGSNFNDLAKTVKNNNVKQVILIGNTTNPDYAPAAPEIEAALQTAGFSDVTRLVKPNGPTMEEIVEAARASAEAGDVVLLSVGCASFDIFENYKDRGNKFKAAVNSL